MPGTDWDRRHREADLDGNGEVEGWFWMASATGLAVLFLCVLFMP
jgi:hypothetical protein